MYKYRGLFRRKEKKMRTLTKERVDLSGLTGDSGASNTSLILNNSFERTYLVARKFREENQKREEENQKIEKNKTEKKLKTEYANRFLRLCAEFFTISDDQARILIRQLKKEDTIKLENTILKKTKKLAIFQAIGFFSLTSFCIASALMGYLLLGFEFLVVIPFLLAPVLWPGWALCDFLYGDPFEVCRNVSYLGRRRQLIKKYGLKYFPLQELEEVLEPKV